MRRFLSACALLAFAGLLSGCGEGGLAAGLRQIGVDPGSPDEFAVLPTRPLEMPPDRSLPPPIPGAANRAAYQPQAEAIAALAGGTPPATAAAPALVGRVGPADPAIRARLAAEDIEYRRRNQPRLLERWFGRDRDRLIYGDMALDADAEWRRLRAAGLRVPAAPPPR